ncbi:hypothetical protein Q5P01_013835 [Channa striata]|uniref:Uncharacterized protein n=1 Tax=Channa striata TaxID=64152 RepID=A0AA88MNL0_CHASR|nr:hypothetical protein Q5P01_013835 [Channa striata]
MWPETGATSGDRGPSTVQSGAPCSPGMLIRGLSPGAALSQEHAGERERHAGKMRYMPLSRAPTAKQEGECHAGESAREADGFKKEKEGINEGHNKSNNGVKAKWLDDSIIAEELKESRCVELPSGPDPPLLPSALRPLQPRSGDLSILSILQSIKETLSTLC